jgi:hypothetical protein
MKNTNKILPLACRATGTFSTTWLCFGLCNAPPTFQRVMDEVLGGLIGTEVSCYIDD